MNKKNKEKLKVILDNLVAEFMTNKTIFLQDPSLFHAYKTGKIVLPGYIRDSGMSRTQIVSAPNFRVLVMLIGHFMGEFTSVKDLFIFVNENKLWHTEYKDYEECNNMVPSMATQIGGGFLVRNFELNENSFQVSQASFDQSFNELISFFSKTYIDIETYVNLYGLKGTTTQIELSSNISIIKADHALSAIFNVNYNGVQDLHTEMFEGDYVLKIKTRTPKTCFNGKQLAAMNRTEKELVEKWTKLPVLSTGGVLHIGRRINMSMDWPLVRIDAVGPYLLKPYQSTFKKDTIFQVDNYIDALKLAFKRIKGVNLGDLDEKIIHSIQRLTKSKEADNVNDRIVELAIAFEYLIKTSSTDVGLTLKLKAIKLLTDKNVDDDLYKNIGKFYDFRSQIIHGKTTKIDIIKSKEILDITEKLVQDLILRYFELNAYSYEQIDKALSKSLYVNMPLIKLLKLPS